MKIFLNLFGSEVFLLLYTICLVILWCLSWLLLLTKAVFVHLVGYVLDVSVKLKNY